jgi:hypothetical protein
MGTDIADIHICLFSVTEGTSEDLDEIAEEGRMRET